MNLHETKAAFLTCGYIFVYYFYFDYLVNFNLKIIDILSTEKNLVTMYLLYVFDTLTP